MAQVSKYQIRRQYRWHPTFILQPVDWILIILGIFLFFFAIWYLCRPAPKKIIRKQKTPTLVQASQKTEVYGTLPSGPSGVSPKRSPKRSRRPPPRTERVDSVIDSYEEAIAAVVKENTDLEKALQKQKEYTVEAYEAGRQHQSEIDNGDVEKGYVIGRLEQYHLDAADREKADKVCTVTERPAEDVADKIADKVAVARLEERAADKVAVARLEERAADKVAVARLEERERFLHDDVKRLQEQLGGHLTLEKQALALENSKLGMAEAERDAARRYEATMESKLAMLETERRLNALEASGNRGLYDQQLKTHALSQETYAQALAQERLMENQRLQQQALLLAEEQRAAQALIVEQRRMEEERTQRLEKIRRNSAEHEVLKMQEELARMSRDRAANERIQEEKQIARKELEDKQREVQQHEARILAYEKESRNVLAVERIRMEEEIRREREAIEEQYEVLAQKRAVDAKLLETERQAAYQSTQIMREKVEAELLAKKITEEEEHLRRRRLLDEELQLEAQLAERRRADLQAETLSTSLAVTHDLANKLATIQQGESLKDTNTKVTINSTRGVKKDEVSIGAGVGFASPRSVTYYTPQEDAVSLDELNVLKPDDPLPLHQYSAVSKEVTVEKRTHMI